MDFFFLILLAMFALLYFMTIRPRQQEQRRHQQMLEQLKVGDEVITAGGIYGEITELDAERVMLEIDDDVRVAVAKRAIASVVPPEELARLEGDEEAPAGAEEPQAADERVKNQARS